MTNLRGKLMAVALVFFVSAGCFSQGNDNKRPQKPRDTPKVVVKDKDKNQKPPPSGNSNKGRNH
jgi:hypothetical protein